MMQHSLAVDGSFLFFKHTDHETPNVQGANPQGHPKDPEEQIHWG